MTKIPHKSTNREMRYVRITGVSMSMGFEEKGALVLADTPAGGGGFRELSYFRCKNIERGSGPNTIASFGRAAGLQSRYFAAIRGVARLKERNPIAQRLFKLHVGRPTSFSVDFMVGTCGRIVSYYNEI